jgi:hypothetical protein
MYKETVQETIDLKKITKQAAQKKLRILFIIGLVLILVFIGLVYFAIRVGGVSNLISGDGNIIQNTAENINEAITTTGIPTPVPTEFKITDTPQNSTEVDIDRDINTIIFIPGQDFYEVTIRKDTQIQFVNQTGKNIGLLFSDGRQVRVEDDSYNYETFLTAGTLNFTDQIDSSELLIRGRIIITN